MKMTLNWKSDRSMRALFSNLGQSNPNHFYLVMVFHKSKRGGFSREISTKECGEILARYNSSYRLVEV